MSRIGRSPTGISGLGRTVVYGRSLVPSPPARITARLIASRVTACFISFRAFFCTVPAMIHTEAAGRAALYGRGVMIVDQGGRGGVSDYTRFLAVALADRGIPVTIAT